MHKCFLLNSPIYDRPAFEELGQLQVVHGVTASERSHLKHEHYWVLPYQEQLNSMRCTARWQLKTTHLGKWCKLSKYPKIQSENWVWALTGSPKPWPNPSYFRSFRFQQVLLELHHSTVRMHLSLVWLEALRGTADHGSFRVGQRSQVWQETLSGQ